MYNHIFLLRRSSQIYAAAQMITDMIDPVVVASPIGNSVSAKVTEAQYAMGIRASTMAATLCAKEIPALPHAQKYPLKQKWIPAKIQSHMYPRMY